jgi:hypothetical protein
MKTKIYMNANKEPDIVVRAKDHSVTAQSYIKLHTRKVPISYFYKSIDVPMIESRFLRATCYCKYINTRRL